MRNFFFLLFTLLFVKAIAQDLKIDYAIDYVSTKEGLPHNYVSKVISDSLNIKWIAQENGITKYDGTNFTRIEPGVKYPGLKSENIETLFLDSENNIWIGTKSGGLSMLNIKTNILENYNEILYKNYNGILRIIAITEDDSGDIWIGSAQNGLFVLDPTSKKLIKHFEIYPVQSLLTDSKGNVWIGSFKNLMKYDPSEDRIIKFPIEGNSIQNVIEDKSRNCLWIATVYPKENTKDHKIFRFDFNSQKITGVPTGINFHFFKSLYLDHKNRLWIGTWGNGVYRSNHDLSKFRKLNLVGSEHSKNTINYENILDIHGDKNKVIWLSTTFAGVVKLTESKGFENLNQVVKNPILQNELNFQSVYSDDNEVWLGTLRSGLFKGKGLSSLEQVTDVEKSKIYSIYKNDNNFYIGSEKKAYILDDKGSKIASKAVKKATGFLVENKNHLWIGTQENGIYNYDISIPENPVLINQYRRNNQRNPLESDRITAIVKDVHENLWIGTYNGLHLFDRQKEKFIHQSQLLNEFIPKIINTIYIDSKFIWVGTPNGLFKLKYNNKKLQIIEKYHEEQGLNNDFICGITKGNNNNLWITTTTNLIRFDQNNNSFKNYGKNDGVYTSQFNLRSFHNHNNALILAGGSGNLTYFKPSNISENENKDEIVFAHLKVNNQKILPGDSINGNVIIDKDINYMGKIILTHDEKSFDLTFTKNDYRNDIASHYRYKLVGYQNEWVYLKNKREVNFIGLPPGNYDLQISASEDYKNWLIPKSLKIKILYAPWSSPLAYILYVLLFLGITSTMVYVFMRQLHTRNKLKKEQELSEAKFTFFTNISHEFRTPLTLILSPLKELNQSTEFEGKVSEKLITMEKNADRLLNLINQLLDFRKAGHGLLKLSVAQGNLVRFSNEVFLYFKEQATSKQITYNFIKDKDEILFPFDRSKMEIVLCNLISNSLKYSMPGSEVTLHITATDDACILTLKDTGFGMDSKSKKKIFDRFYQINSTNTTNIIGSGIGLSFTKKIIELHHGTINVESKVNKGTEFIVEFPLDGELYKSTDFQVDEINTDKIETYKNLSLVGSVVNDLKVSSKENTILLVDDNEEIRNYLKQLLSDEYNILEAGDGEEGTAVASIEIPDLILCDIMMPKKDGLAVCKELKEQVTTSHIPILLLTARTSNIYEIKGLETGADDFITKPFDPKIIKARISSALQNRTKLREHFLNKIRFEPSSLESVSKDPETVFIDGVVKLVEENLLNENFGIETLMEKLFMSQSTLYRKIKSLTGLSLTGFIRSIRLKKAAELILSENVKLSAVATSVGFNDYKYFGDSFKKQFGCLPSEYKSEKKS